MNYNPPSFRQPRDYPVSLDGIFEAYSRDVAQKEQTKRQDFADALQFGTPIRGLTGDQMQRGLAGPPAPLEQGPTSTGQPLGQPQFDADPHVAAIQRFIMRKRMGEDAQLAGNIADARLKTSMIGKNDAEAAKARAEAAGGGISLSERAKIESQLYDDYRNAQPVKNFTQIRDAYRNVAALAKSPSGINDVGIVYSLVKMLDPNSAVREGEISLSNQATPLAQKIATAWNNAAQGRVGNDEKNRLILAAAKSLYAEAKKGVDTERTALSRRGAQYGINSDVVLPDLAIPNDELSKIEPPRQFATAAAVKAAYQSGKITREQARSEIAALGGINGR